MTADVQMVIVFVIMAIAVALLVRLFAKTIFGRKKPGCGSGCGKCAEPAPSDSRRFPLSQI